MPDQIAFAHRFDGITGSAIREIFKLIAQPDMISFAGGNPSPSALPDAEAARIAGEVLRESGKTILQYGATEGYRPFLESLKPYAEQAIGCELPGVLPVTGSTQAMDLLCKSMIDPGDAILVENPSFLGNLQCMKLYQARLVPVESDEGGLIPEKLEAAMVEHRPKMLYVIPNFQNPTGSTLAADRRPLIAELAAKHHVVVAEDDPYRDLRYRGEFLPSIKSFDKEGWVVFMGSFSKIISPGLRVEGFLPGHIARIRKDYAAQMDAMLGELAAFPEGVKYTRPEGGLFIWVELPEKLNALELLQKAIAKHVAYVPGTHFFAGGGHENTLRLNFSNSSIDQIRTGMKALREVFEEALQS